jgi:hypothetical protein
MATTTKPKAPRNALDDLPLAARLAHDHGMAVLKSSATADILEEDGNQTSRLIYLGKEYASMFIKAHGVSA